MSSALLSAPPDVLGRILAVSDDVARRTISVCWVAWKQS